MNPAGPPASTWPNCRLTAACVPNPKATASSRWFNPPDNIGVESMHLIIFASNPPATAAKRFQFTSRTGPSRCATSPRNRRRSVSVRDKPELAYFFWCVKVGALCLASHTNLIHAKAPVDYVDPKIGTAIKSKRWMLFPGATTPIGMVALSPDNLDRTGWYKGGFDPHLNNIAGCSHANRFPNSFAGSRSSAGTPVRA